MLLNASLSAKLQSPSAPVDLEDRRMARGASVARPNPASALKPAENLDMIVEHQLVELGTHTLRVSARGSAFVCFSSGVFCVNGLSPFFFHNR